VLKAKSGTLAETPLPLLMHALLVQEQSVVLELKLRNLEKRVFFENGVPVGCDSNLMHETLGHSLIEKKKLTAEQHRQLLAESAASERSLQTLLVEKQLISGFELFKHLQASLGRTVLDAFRWSGATWRILPSRYAVRIRRFSRARPQLARLRARRSTAPRPKRRWPQSFRPPLNDH
jgi:hypothetical protein